MRSKHFCRFLAFLLVFVMAVEFVPVYAVEELKEFLSSASDTVAASVPTQAPSPQETAAPTQEPVVIREDLSRREADTKHFLLSDGSYIAAKYKEPVHFKNDANVWQEIDNSLIYEQSSADNGLFEGFRTKANDFTVKFASDVQGNKLVQVSQDSYSLSWHYLPAFSRSLNRTLGSVRESFAAAAVTERLEASAEAMQEEVKLENIKSAFRYANIESGVDLNYTVEPEAVKEDILIKEKKDQYIFRMKLYMENVTPVLQADGSVLFTANDTGEEVFLIPQPYMYDAAGAYSEAVSYSLENDLLTVTADKTWINVEERAFPVTIDPIIEKRMGKNEVKDITLSSHADYKNNTTLNTYGAVYVGKDWGYDTARGLYHFELPDTIPNNSYIYRAVLSLCQSYYTRETEDKTPIQINAYEAEKSWASDTSRQSWSGYYGNGSTSKPSDPIDYFLCGPLKETSVTEGNVTTITTHLEYKHIDISNQVQKWLNIPSANNGILLAYTEDGGKAEENPNANAMIRLVSPDSQSMGSEYYPFLQIAYLDTTGKDDFSTYKSYSLTDGGTVYLNEYNGMTTYEKTVYSLPGERLTTDVSLIFCIPWLGSDGNYGTSFGINLRQYVQPVTDAKLLAKGYDYIVRDADGTLLYFSKPSGETEYIDEVGRGLTLSKSGSRYILKDQDDNRLEFSKSLNGRIYLTDMYDNENNHVTIAYDSGDPTRIVSVTDAGGRKATFQYGSDGLLSSIKNNKGSIVSSFTYSGRRLTKIKDHTINCETTFTYDAYGRIASVSNEFDTIYLTYDSMYRMTSLAEGNSSNVLFTASYENYAKNQTVFMHQGPGYDVTADDAVREVCTFNRYGQRAGHYYTTANGRKILGIAGEEYTATHMGNTETKSAIRNNNKLITSNAVYETVNLVTNSSIENGVWPKTEWTANMTPASYFGQATDVSYIGAKSLKIKADNMTDGVRSFYQGVDLPAGTYTISAYVKTQNVTGTGVFVGGNLFKNNVAESHQFSEYLTGTTSTEINHGWQRLSLTVEIPSSGYTLQVSVGMRENTKGTVYFDCIQLEEGKAANQYNLVDNGGFEAELTGWTRNSVSCNYTGAEKIDGNGFYLKGIIQGERTISQVIDISRGDLKTFTLSGWGKAKSASDIEKSYRYNNAEKKVKAAFRLKAECTYSDGSTATMADLDFDLYTKAWQPVSKSFTVAKEGKTPVSVKISCIYANNFDFAYLDNIQLVPDTYVKFSYNDEGLLSKVENEKGETATAEYTGANELQTITDKDGLNSHKRYDSTKKHRLLAYSDQDTTTELEYDANGNVTKTKVSANPVMNYGLYYITSANRTVIRDGETVPLSIDSPARANAIGTKLISYPFQKVINQQFRLRESDTHTGYYTISNLCAPDRVIGVSGNNVTMQEYTGGDAQLWKITQDTAGIYRIYPKSDESKCLTLPTSEGLVYLSTAGSKDTGSYFKFQMLDVEESVASKSTVTGYTLTMPGDEIAEGYSYYVRCTQDNYFMQIDGNVATAGKKINAGTFTGEQLQRFKFIRVEGTDNYMIAPERSSTMVFGVTEAVNGAEIELQKMTGAVTQQWNFVESQDGSFLILSVADDGLKMMSTAYGTNPLRLAPLAKRFWIYRCDAMDDMPEISSGATYTPSGMYVSSVTDSRGYKTSYTYDENTGKLTKKVDAKGNVYQNYYDDNPMREFSTMFLDLNKDGVEGANTETGVMYIHPHNRLTEISSRGATYLFDYQPNGNVKTIKVGSRTLASYTYGNRGKGSLNRMDYGNGDYFTYTYDALGRVEKVEYVNGTERHHYLYSYDNAGNVASVYDSQRNVTVRTYYDSEGNVYGWSSSDGKSFSQGVDEKDRVVLAQYKWGNAEQSYRYTYAEEIGKDHELASVTLPNGATAESKRDGFDRVTGTEIRQGTDSLTSRISYLAGSGKNTTALVKKVQSLDGTELTYYYDQLGNITSVQWPDEEDCDSEIYQYDALNQLIRADRYDLGTTVTYRYDTAGNIQEKKEYDWTANPIREGTAPLKTVTYTYGDASWKDLLTAYDGKQITYDGIGNPLMYYNGMEFGWSNGRQLTSVQIDENTTMALEYDENGMRSKKTIETIVSGDVLKEEYSYYYASGALVGMQYRNWYNDYEGEFWYIWFLYDEKGEMIGLTDASGKSYYYVKNAQGDVLALIDIEGNVAAKYQYDTWGKVVSVKKADGTDLTRSGHIGYVNPIRYRGYVYDNETGLYYLSSRYYDAETGRFINADGYVSTGQGLLGHNMFAYCNNNPVNFVDPSGECCDCDHQIRCIARVMQKPYEEVAAHVALSCSESFTTDEIRICTDGMKPGKIPDEHARHDTAFSLWEEKVSVTTLNPYTVPYVVIPKGSDIANKGDKALLINHTTQKAVLCVVGEVGPAENGLGEVSIKAIWDTGNPNHMTANSAPAGTFEIIFFKGQSYGFDWDNTDLTVYYTWDDHLYWRKKEDGY